MMFDSSSICRYEPDDPYEYYDYYDHYNSDSDRGYMASPTYQTDPDMDVTCSLLEKKEPEAMSRDKGVVSSLSFQAANVIGARLPFEAVELWAQRLGKKMADEVQLAVMKASFPVDKGLVRRYAYLSRKTSGYGKFSDLFQQPTRTRMQTDNLEFAVEDVMQIGKCMAIRTA